MADVNEMYFDPNIVKANQQNAVTFIQEYITENRVVVFGKSSEYTTKIAVDALYTILDKSKVVVVYIDQRKDTVAIREAFIKFTGNHFTPRVFIDGQFIGGGNETKEKVESGELATLLKSKGIL